MKKIVIWFCLGYSMGKFEPEFIDVGPVEIVSSKFINYEKSKFIK